MQDAAVFTGPPSPMLLGDVLCEGLVSAEFSIFDS